MNLKINRATGKRGNVLFSVNFTSSCVARRMVRNALGVTRLTSPQAREVDAAVRRHCTRRQPKNTSHQPNRVLKMQAEKRAKYAVGLGQAYNDRIKSLYTSKHAAVVEGRGGQRGFEYNPTGWGKKWQNAGARWETGAGKHYVVLENSLGREVTRIRVSANAPPERAGGWYTEHPGLLHGDLYGVLRHGVLVRYNAKHVKTGVSVMLTNITAPDKWGNPKRTFQAWEHAETLRACRRENAHKLAVREQAWQNTELSESRIEHVTNLIVRLCDRAQVCYTDARQLGYCDQGIKAWCKKHKLSVGGVATFADLRGDAMSEAVMRLVARRKAHEIVASRSQVVNQHCQAR